MRKTPFLVAAVVAATILAAGVCLWSRARQGLVAQYRQTVYEASNLTEQQRRQLLAMADSGQLPGFAIQLPGGKMITLSAPVWLTGFSLVGATTVIGVCFGVAYRFAVRPPSISTETPPRLNTGKPS